MTEKYQPIPHRLKNMAVGGHVAGAVDILDDSKGKNQAAVNEEVDIALGNRYTKDEVYNKEESNNIASAYTSQKYATVVATSGTTSSDIATLIATQEPSKKEATDTIYRVANFDGTEYDVTKYSEYTYNGSSYILMDVKSPGIDENPTAGSRKLVESGGVNKFFGESFGSNDAIEFSVSPYNIKADGTYGTSTAYKHAAIPVEEGEVYYIISTADICRAAFTTSNEVESGGDIPLVSGTEVMLMPSIGSVYKFVIPANCEYLMFNAGSNYNNPKCYKHYGTLKAATDVYSDNAPAILNDKLVKSHGTNNSIIVNAGNGNAAYSTIVNDYVPVGEPWERKMLRTSDLSEGDTITDANFEDTGSGIHLILDTTKYNNDYIEWTDIKYKLNSSTSFHMITLLDEDYKVVYVGQYMSTDGEYKPNPAFKNYTYRYIVFNNILESQPNPGVIIKLRDKTTVKNVEQTFTDAQKNQVNKNLGLYSTEIVSPVEVYKKAFINIETGEFVEAVGYNATRVKMYAVDQNTDYFASGRTTDNPVYCSIAYYNAQNEYIGHDKDGGHAASFNEYLLTVPQNAAYVAIYGRTDKDYPPSLKKTFYFKDLNFETMGDGGFAEKLKGKTIAIIGASVDTHGNSGANKNAVEITIEEEDVGVELSAYVTYHDVEGGLSIGGTTFTNADIGTEVTFTPTVEDIGKVIGKPRNYNSNGMKVWWQYIQDYFDCDVIPVCWSGSGYTRNRQGGSSGYQYYTSHAWHEAQIRKCGIRTPGTMERTAPDVIIISRTLNDFTHSPYARITEGYFDTVNWSYPDSDIRQDGNYGLLEGISLTIKNLREAYPFTPIVLMDGCPCKRLTEYHNGNFPMNNGLNNQPQLNKAIKDAADFFGCQFIPRSKCAITWENMYPTYVDDSATIPTHPNEKGHEVIGKFVVDYLKLMNFTV